MIITYPDSSSVAMANVHMASFDWSISSLSSDWSESDSNCFRHKISFLYIAINKVNQF